LYAASRIRFESNFNARLPSPDLADFGLNFSPIRVNLKQPWDLMPWEIKNGNILSIKQLLTALLMNEFIIKSDTMGENMNSALPIGVFDSGIGGLTVVRALHKAMPQEDIVYLGDTARMPYGTKSPKTIVHFSCEDAQFLMQRQVKAIIAACGTVSSWALPMLQERFSVPVVGVIEPGVQAALKVSRNHRIGVIATNATVRSMAYNRAILKSNPEAEVFSTGCPLLIPLVETGWTHHHVTRLVLKEYLDPLRQQNIDTLVLACTHFALVSDLIQEVADGDVQLVDCAEACALSVSQRLTALDLQNKKLRTGTIQCFVTDESERFSELSTQFLGESIDPAMQVDLAPV
jgi:glutamate racemase